MRRRTSPRSQLIIRSAAAPAPLPECSLECPANTTATAITLIVDVAFSLRLV